MREPARLPGIFLRNRRAEQRIWTLPLDEIAIRLGAAAGAGILIGFNRDLHNKPIGMRTLGLVAIGAAAVTIATIQVPGMFEHPDALSRVVQGIIQARSYSRCWLERAIWNDDK